MFRDVTNVVVKRPGEETAGGAASPKGLAICGNRQPAGGVGERRAEMVCPLATTIRSIEGDQERTDLATKSGRTKP